MTFTPFNYKPNQPAKPQDGFTPFDMNQTPQTPPQLGTLPMPISSSSGNFGQNLMTAGKDIGTGMAKSAIRGTIDVASGLQKAGQFVLGGITGTKPKGIESLDDQGVQQTLKSKNRGEQVGTGLETALELGTGFVKSGAEQAVKTGYNAFKEARGAKLAEKELQDSIKTVGPKLTPTLEAEAKAAGRGTTKGKIMKTTEILPSKTESEMGQFAHEAGVNSSNTFDKNIKLMKDAQKSSAETLRSGLKNALGSWSKNDVVSTLNNIEKPLTIKSDTTLSRLADNFKKAILDITEKSNKKPEGILDLRQGVDDLIDKEFPANIYSKDTPVGQYVRKIRTALNDLAESKLPEGKLPNGLSFKEELRRQHLLYDAIDNVAEKAPKAGESARPILEKVRSFPKKHPYITAGASGAAGVLGLQGAINKIKGLFSN